MAGYRPKSLDELNSLYDKSTSAKNEIYKKASVLEEKSEVYTPVVSDNSTSEEAPVISREEVAAEEISGLVGDFIKSFGNPVPVKKVRPATVVATPVKPVSSVKAPAEAAPVSPEGQFSAPVYTPAPEKPKLIRNDERNELFEDYKKVMNDEDEEENSRFRRGRRKGKKLFEKKSSVPEIAGEESSLPGADETADIGELPDTSYESSVAEPIVEEPEIPETLENIDAVIEKVLGRPVTQNIAYDENPEEEEKEESFEEPEEVIEIVEQDAQEEIIIPDTSDDAEVIVPEEEAVQDEAVTQEDTAESVSENEELEEEAPEEDLYEDDFESVGGSFDYAEHEQNYDEFESDYTNEEAQPDDSESSDDDAEDFQSDYKAPSKKRYTVKNILLVLVFLVLLLATAVSAIKAFSGINSDSLIADKYYLCTAHSDFVQAGISEGDLVVVSCEDIQYGDVFAFSEGNGEYGFARLEIDLNEESVVADTDGQKSIVFKNSLRGVFYKSYPVIGGIAALIITHHLYIVGALFLLAVILLLIAVFAFGKKKDKAASKSRKKEKAQQDEEAQEESAEREQSSYNDVDDDFRYLIQDEEGDDFDLYRREYVEESDDEALPGYGADDYKYEPDEYVR